VLGAYHARHTSGAADRRMAERAVQDCRAAEQRRLRQEVARLWAQQCAELAALRATGTPAGSAREGEQP